MTAMKPVDQPRRIADEISDQIAALFNGDLSHGKSIAEIVERALTQPKPDSTSAPRVDLTVTCPDCAKVFEATPLVPENFVTPEFTELVLGFAKIGKMLNGPARPIMEQIYDAMEASAAQPKASETDATIEEAQEFLRKEAEVLNVPAFGEFLKSYPVMIPCCMASFANSRRTAQPKAVAPEMEARVEEIRSALAPFAVFVDEWQTGTRKTPIFKLEDCVRAQNALTTLDALREGK